ncbi:hypothetical protein MES5069_520011 [Mesorhizobium escarrei]|uniref:Uncharacterized protein n=2 Tax=Mesorhizobium escarrei TaxID=666018 RepID=A0ABM9EAH1_9HYPH|nr:hypothetical protein MES5069_520011 [Mesorhizobium escarrei]
MNTLDRRFALAYDGLDGLRRKSQIKLEGISIGDAVPNAVLRKSAVRRF